MRLPWASRGQKQEVLAGQKVPGARRAVGRKSFMAQVWILSGLIVAPASHTSTQAVQMAVCPTDVFRETAQWDRWWTDGWMEGWVEGRKLGRLGGWKDGWIDFKELACAVVETGRSYLLKAGQETRNAGRNGC